MGPSFSDTIENVLERLRSEGALSTEQFEAMAPTIADQMMDRFAAQICRDLKRQASKRVNQLRREERGFNKRNIQRWREAFDLIELLWDLTEERGSKFNEDERPRIVAERDHRCEALIHIHARSLLVASEAICLMKSGFPDGALGRWRTLHELRVIAAFLIHQPDQVALRYGRAIAACFRPLRSLT
ncbi:MULTISPECIES: DUF5677 domain-containing protein [unclassified Bradyrhizobium]|uniref:DUF5677 domain-containing protein n=1 Tax=unclassified Bradyrhizobium TaxID=2631580 RepID=UPI001BA69DCD|nr:MULTISPECIES: DUF5677 domain-containing protein [unclassified Bradyrhizobium]MBR1208748.1 hypothetical protein [Bradyrhizobium sp. AUGA SZCCT0124]MBR1316941.1 hypothetical protein [Bradyrhizobium sp. AUGA SZCCT0051]MBR1345263.1 hypothetical protein [Bradyrhizobium sp. AUGA SZCCT0105]MBR1360035.1 hypothetical protein [Bradyrhizobium sp. AUGA SZCCT0045]